MAVVFDTRLALFSLCLPLKSNGFSICDTVIQSLTHIAASIQDMVVRRSRKCALSENTPRFVYQRLSAF
jgi:hypothetical protein